MFSVHDQQVLFEIMGRFLHRLSMRVELPAFWAYHKPVGVKQTLESLSTALVFTRSYLTERHPRVTGTQLTDHWKHTLALAKEAQINDSLAPSLPAHVEQWHTPAEWQTHPATSGIRQRAEELEASCAEVLAKLPLYTTGE